MESQSRLSSPDPLTEDLENHWYELHRLAIAETKRRYPPAYEKPDEYRKAAERGDADAQYRIGNIYLRGKTVERSLREAGRWNRRAALQGHADAQFRLGLAYKTGEGAVYDDAEAIKWFSAAAEQGHADAQFHLGNMYEPYNADEAITWYKKAAEDDDYSFNHIAQYRLGRVYERGKDLTEAVRWYRKAAEINSDAQYRLGLLHEAGNGLPEDLSEAAEWYRKAAEQGNAEAQYKIGCMCHLDHDFVEAYKWFALAAMMFFIMVDAENMEAAITNRKYVAEQMTPQQIEDAQLASRKWQEKMSLLEGHTPPPTLRLVLGA
jgi:TPR repeat protein